MDISLAFGCFAALLASWAIAARRNRVHLAATTLRPGEPGFLRRLAS